MSLQAFRRALCLFLTRALAKTSPFWHLTFVLCEMGSVSPSIQGRVELQGVLGCLGSLWPCDPSVRGSVRLIGLAQLNCSELKLKRLCCRHGLLGVDKVLGYALNEWLQDIRKNQLPGLLGGVGPMHSVVQLCEYLTFGALETAILGQPRSRSGELSGRVPAAG